MPGSLPRILRCCGWLADYLLTRCSGAFTPHPGHDPHVHATLSAIQILATHDALDRLDGKRDAIVQCACHHRTTVADRADIVSLQDTETGSFAGDEWGEVDTRFSYCAISALSLLGRLDAIDRDRAAEWIGRCRNFDGGFGTTEGAESHAAYGAAVLPAVSPCVRPIDLRRQRWRGKTWLS